MSTGLEQLAPFDGKDLRVVIEASAGSRSKFKYDPQLGVFALHHVLPAGTAFPLDFGFIPGTRGGDGDPLDALVFTDEPTPVGMLLPARLVGVVVATQGKPGKPRVRNDRYLAVASKSRAYAGWRDLADVPRELLVAIETFFVSYNAQRGTDFEVQARGGAARALRELRRSG